MNHIKLQLFNPQQCQAMLDNIKNGEWIDGRTTAGAQARDGKINEQIVHTSALRAEIQNLVQQAMWAHPAIKSFCVPRKLHRFLISRTRTGGGYDSHVDNAYMSSGRSDLSFTLCLSDQHSFAGGSLEVDTLTDSLELALQQGEIVIYPSSTMHRVNTVTSGERVACVGWIESYLKNETDRVTLFQLDTGARGLLAKHGRSEELDLVFLAYTNLLRSLGT
ncbi:iron-uptake factor PiuC [Synechococcus sp. BIOS-E4-1]|uniref:Fe2+-dependent dioxygenase n=1 Tax=Synechococcus sp. BIOS-E4-1 TaxID=1400864 RepID=UPI0016441CD8|nr:Fe2+-dependent dioxygenase [Synechococcus sp. BIOS-E4-1]QNI54318.1 iron-uptake factor PiuC [Synechococcus sp. BIOS-E4-1]